MPRGFRGPLLNSASPWATTKEELSELYSCPYTGAVTIRTSLLDGWQHDDNVHKWTFFDARVNIAVPERSPNANSSFNTLGYSPVPLHQYLDMIEAIVTESRAPPNKPFVVSVTGSPDDIIRCREMISDRAAAKSIPLLMEINLSCPNIPGNPPPAYSSSVLKQYLLALQRDSPSRENGSNIPVGIKTAPYTHHEQFKSVIEALSATTSNELACPIDFITATNTLGSCLLLEEPSSISSRGPALPGAQDVDMGGVGGTAIHALSLGNVRKLRSLLDQNDKLKQIEIIGVGGVNDFLGFNRMKSAGASAVAIGTAFGRDGIDIFHRISAELQAATNTMHNAG